jgi:vancomycin resistance protein YoaR
LPDRAKHLIAALLAVVICVVVWDFFYWTGRFPPNCFIEKIDVSGLSKYEALKILKNAHVDQAYIWPIKLTLNNEVGTFKPSQLGLYIAPRKTIINASKHIYRSNYIIDLIRRATNSYEKKVLFLALEADPDIYKAILQGMANNFDIPTKDANFALMDGGKYRITKEKIGKRMDIGLSVIQMQAALINNERTASIAVDTLLPRVYARDLVKYPPKYPLGEYTTYYGSHDSSNRVHNIKLSSSRTNNYVVVSGEVFSLLSVLGDFSGDSGYKEAFVLYDGKLEPQFGGGSCQIASTLYNAVLLAGLEIVERHNHGIYFTIYPLGRDASIYSPSRDLKFANNTNHPLYIKTFATDKKLTYKIFGTPTGKKVTIARPMIFFEGEKFIAYNVMTDEAKTKIQEALLSGRSYFTYVKVFTGQAGYETEKVIWSHYKVTGDRENVTIVRPEPE